MQDEVHKLVLREIFLCLELSDVGPMFCSVFFHTPRSANLLLEAPYADKQNSRTSIGSSRKASWGRKSPV